MSYAALLRPAVDRLYIGVRGATRDRVKAVYDRFGLKPGFELSFYFGLLARPMPADGFAAATTYGGADMTDELTQGTAEVDASGCWQLTPLGRELALAVQRAIGHGAEELWGRHAGALPGLALVPRMATLVGRVLENAAASGGPAFRAMAPVYEPADASASLRLMTRLGALRHHRADAHRAAWTAAGLTLDELRAMPPGPVRDSIEAQTNRLDEPAYGVLSEDERWELLAGLAALPG